MNKKIISLIIVVFLLLSGCEDEVTPPTTITPIEYGSLSGIVQDAETGEPITGALVEAVLSQVTDSTDSGGAFFLDSLLLGDESITVISDFFENQFLELNITTDSQTVNVSMGPLLENQYLYVAEWLGHNIHIIDVDKQEMVDSLYFSEGNIERLLITPGGTKLYIYVSAVKKIFFLDIKTRTFHSTNLPYEILSFSPYDDQLFGFSDDGIFIVDTLSDAAAQIDAINPLIGASSFAFSPTSPIFYISKRGSLFTYDYQQAIIIDSSKIFIRKMAVTPGGRELYFIGDYVGVWDIQNDSSSEISGSADTSIPIILVDSRIGITPNGDYTLITEGPTNILFPRPITGLIHVISTSNHKIHGYIDLKPFGGSSLDIVFSKSGRYAYVNGLPSGRITLVDLYKMNAIKSFNFNHQVFPMAIGPKN